jgi:hypothetical protein
MNKALEQLMERASGWPEEAQSEAVRALSVIEEKYVSGSDVEASQGSDKDIEAVRAKLKSSIADPRPDIPFDKSFDRIEHHHAERMKAR